MIMARAFQGSCGLQGAPVQLPQLWGHLPGLAREARDWEDQEERVLTLPSPLPGICSSSLLAFLEEGCVCASVWLAFL